MKNIFELNLHEELVIQEDDLAITTAMRVPGGLIYKFFESNNSTIFVLLCTEFVAYKFKDEIEENQSGTKQILNS